MSENGNVDDVTSRFELNSRRIPLVPVALAMKENRAFNPIDMNSVGANAVVPVADPPSHRLQQRRHGTRTI